MSRPDCFVAGFYKCGTTSLYQILRQHRNILVSEEKENFFFGDITLYRKGISWYEKAYYAFSKNNTEDKVIEINPELSEIQGTARRLRRYYSSETPIIFVVRNPIDFLYSNFKFQISRGAWSLKEIKYCRKSSFSVAFDYYVKNKGTNIKYYKKLYSSQIKEYKRYFNNIKIIFLEDMQKNPEKVYCDIIDFFNLKYDCVNVNIKANVTDSIPKYPLIQKLYLHLRVFNKNLRAEEKNGGIYCFHSLTAFLEDKLFEFTRRNQISDKSKVSMRTRKSLQNFFENEKNFMESETGRSLQDIWW